MDFKHKYIAFAILAILAIALNACGASASNTSTIGTAVALTVQAQNTQQAQFTSTLPAISDIPSLMAPPTIGATQAPPTAPPTGAAGSKFCTASATFVSETVPDGTIEQPGAQFLKTWRIQNSGTCSWDSTWQFVYVSGDVMGGAFVYNFPQPAAPGETVDVPVAFTAPTSDGQHTGYWKIKSPWGLVFGDSGSGNPFWVQIVVGSGTPGKGTATAFGITSVTYDITQRNDCSAANIFYTITANIASNGPLTITYYFKHSDGGIGVKGTLKFTQADTKSIPDVWSVHLGSTNNPRWDQLIVTAPTYQEFGKQSFTYPCH